MSVLPHLDAQGAAHMVDVSEKPHTRRMAVAEARVSMLPETVALIERSELAKGDALAVARIAGIAGAKRAPDLLPLAHPLSLTHVAVELTLEADGVRVVARTQNEGPTGVEMEAMTAASVAALNLYDMIKGKDRSAEIRSVRLLEKAGGRSGHWIRD